MNDPELTIKKLSFNPRPVSVPVGYRPVYKIAIIVLILRLSCRSETANLLKLHLLSWALSSDDNLLKLKEHIKSNFTSEFSVWGIEPALNRALSLAVAENICEVVTGASYKLTEKGFRFYEIIIQEKELFSNEIEFLSFIGKNKITDKRINAMSKQWAI